MFNCIWSSWCRCHPKTPSSLASFKSRLVLPFWYRLTQVVGLLEKRPLNGPSSDSRLYLEVESEVVDRDGVLACVVLHDSGEEGLREKEARHPEHRRLSVVMPVLHSHHHRRRHHLFIYLI